MSDTPDAPLPVPPTALETMLNLLPVRALAKRAAVRQVKLFAPGWDAAKTRSLVDTLQQAKALVMTTSLNGLGDDEILSDIQAAWPNLGITKVSLEGESCMVLDAA